MKQIIGGVGLDITGALLWLVALMGMNWQRIKSYGLLHELYLGGWFHVLVFLLGTIFIIAGTIMIFTGVYIGDDEEFYDK